MTNTPQSHESFEADLSALLDGELAAEDLLITLDYLVESRQARDFYARARGLGSLLVAGGQKEPGAETRPERLPGLWPAIQRRSGLRVGRLLSFPGRLPAWSLQAAAVVVLAVGLWTLGALLPEFRNPSPEPTDQVVQLALGSDAGRMTDDRFVDLTTEILESDDRYRNKMLEIMQEVAVVAAGSEPEASTQDDWDRRSSREGPLPSGDDDEAGRPEPPGLW